MPPTGQDPPQDPPLKVVQGGKAPIRKVVPHALYEAMAETYINGNRSIGELERVHRVARSTAKKAIERGWPDKGWAPLKKRAADYDRIASAARQEVAAAPPPSIDKEEAASWLLIRKQHLDLAIAARSVLAHCILQLREAVKSAVATTTKPLRQVAYEEVLDGQGKVFKRVPKTIVVDVERAPSLFDIVGALRDAASTLKETGNHELGIANADVPKSMRDEGKTGTAADISDDDLKYMLEHGGRLPPGMTIQMLMGRQS